jgi:hypothetical protein
MKPRGSLHIVGVIVLVVAFMAGAVELQAIRERAYPPAEEVEDALYLTSGTALRRMTVSMNALAADVYWIRTIQYFGSTKRRLMLAPKVAPPPPAIAASFDYDQLYPMLDVTTSLDPRFKIAYRFGAVFLAEPDKWEYMEDIGFVHYWYDHDYRAAAAVFQKASEMPDAPWWLRSLAATTLAQGGDRESSRTMWRHIRESAEIDWLKRDAERRLSQLDALDQIDEMQRLVDRYGRQNGRPPADWLTLIRARVVGRVPVDPSRTPYEIAQDGRVRLSESSPLWPLPEEPQRTGPTSGS